MSVSMKRVYDTPASTDGYRVLVDRLWPRGVSKQKAKLDEWLKEVAPSNELREWFGHKPERFNEFRTRYEAELKSNPAVKTLEDIIADHKVVTLLYGAHDTRDNQARVLLEYIAKQWV